MMDSEPAENRRSGRKGVSIVLAVICTHASDYSPDLLISGKTPDKVIELIRFFHI